MCVIYRVENLWSLRITGIILDLPQAGAAGNVIYDLMERRQLILVRRLREVSDPSDVNASISKVILGAQVGEPIQFLVAADAGIGAVLRDDQTVGAESLTGVTTEDVALDEDVVVGPGVDGLEVKVVVVVVVDVLAAETTRWATGTLALPAVVVVGDAELEGIHLAQHVAVTDQR